MMLRAFFAVVFCAALAVSAWCSERAADGTEVFGGTVRSTCASGKPGGPLEIMLENGVSARVMITFDMIDFMNTNRFSFDANGTDDKGTARIRACLHPYNGPNPAMMCPSPKGKVSFTEEADFFDGKIQIDDGADHVTYAFHVKRLNDKPVCQ